ncbi:MAG: hypothetical protein Q4G60_10775 [bacterium]|nr:hypothetical protein [bacterium]
MAVFNDTLTVEGERLVGKMLAGTARIQFTRMECGDGYLPAGVTAKNVSSMMHTVISKEVSGTELSGDNVVTVSSAFSNEDMTEGFYFREKGIFAKEYGGSNEVLMIYSNNGSLAEWIEPPSSQFIEKLIRSIIAFEETDNVDIIVSTAVYITIDNVNNIIKKSDYNGYLHVNGQEILVYEHVNEGKRNPHGVTKEDLGLGDVENISPEEIAKYITINNISIDDIPPEMPEPGASLEEIMAIIMRYIRNIKDMAFKGHDNNLQLMQRYLPVSDRENGCIYMYVSMDRNCKIFYFNFFYIPMFETSSFIDLDTSSFADIDISSYVDLNASSTVDIEDRAAKTIYGRLGNTKTSQEVMAETIGKAYELNTYMLQPDEEITRTAGVLYLASAELRPTPTETD